MSLAFVAKNATLVVMEVINVAIIALEVEEGNREGCRRLVSQTKEMALVQSKDRDQGT
jgi:hypothetical protein